MANEIYNTTWWGNAIDTAITAGTEPDFFGSQMKMLTSQQPEEITNGDFSDGSTGWVTYTSGSSTVEFTDVANLNIVCGEFSFIFQNKSYTSGKTYKVTAQIQGAIGSSGKQMRLQDNQSNLGGLFNVITLDETTQFLSFYFTANSNSNMIQISRHTGTGDYSFSIDNVSIKLARAEEVEAVKCLADWIHTTALQDLNN